MENEEGILKEQGPGMEKENNIGLSSRMDKDEVKDGLAG